MKRPPILPYVVTGAAGALVASLLPFLSSSTQAAPRLLPFQGRLTDASGMPVGDGAKVVQFKIYDAPTGGTAKWNGEVQKVTVNGGLVSTLFGSKADLSNVDFNQSLYLEITVDAQAVGQAGNGTIDASDPPLLPRQSILPAVFAVEASQITVRGPIGERVAGAGWEAVFDNGNPATGKIPGAKIADGTIQGSHFAGGDLLLPGSISTAHDGRLVARYSDPPNLFSAALAWSSLQLGNNGSNFIIAGRSIPGGSLRFVTDNTNDFDAHTTPHNGKEVMTLTAEANVGIGTISPSATLEIKGTVKAFGAWTSRTLGAVYQAPSDGFVVVTVYGTSGGSRVMGYTDQNNPPTTERSVVSHDYARTSVDRASFTMPVRKGDFYRVERAGTAAETSVAIEWLPLGQ